MMIRTLSREEAIDRMNTYGKRGLPFLFLIDFELERPIVLKLNEVHEDELLYFINGHSNSRELTPSKEEFFFEKKPVSRAIYSRAFQLVQRHLHAGDTYLLNLAFPTPVESNLSLREIFLRSQACYRVWLNGQFTCFSPEAFVRIQCGQISAYPMKGTIDASLPDAEALLLGNEKEKAEHATIVDLIRNDLSLVARQVRVKRYRYTEEITTHQGGLLQNSSEIVGQLPDDYQAQLGDILFQLLPAGSISGAPKGRTVEVIRAAEQKSRGYYTGICGLFDGQVLDSGVMIRFMEAQPDGLVFKSGGGITARSTEAEEYDELVRKAYLPFFVTTEALAR